VADPSQSHHSQRAGLSTFAGDENDLAISVRLGADSMPFGPSSERGPQLASTGELVDEAGDISGVEVDALYLVEQGSGEATVTECMRNLTVVQGTLEVRGDGTSPHGCS
jgi:hypothetical protein